MVDIDNSEVMRALKEHSEYCKDKKVIQSNNFFVAIYKEGIIATGELYILNKEKAKVDIYLNHDDINKEKLIERFINEILYWNPFLKYIDYGKGEFHNQCPANLMKISIEDIQPSQLYISEEKLSNVSNWLDSKEKVIIPIVKINDTYVSTDGHTRLVQAYINGYKNVFVYNDTDVNPETSKVFVNWCRDEGISGIKELADRLLCQKEYEVKWIGRCQGYFKSLKEEV
ncbi:hypothetical protein GOQ27_04160 [Clostridium sp. D2Q-11]|uniref:ParB/Sulfiredoxin domain-containing protein n=1 Tax=Anaeromonas frigoriresistens TaxID=2683708 RepID=A0A942US90_9FIRM|nr:hypothetical protein [Anaeromonas frigoriresistens]MBS4537643.1 hypothetical protein [Anaeromonas frigoriresistens]